MSKTGGPLVVSEDVRLALKNGRPVVALETAVITHGLPKEIGLTAYREMWGEVVEGGAVPASVGILDGVLVVGLTLDEVKDLGAAQGVEKAALGDLPIFTAGRVSAGTTVGATLFAARKAGITILATGGIGGVHRGAERTFDVSGDLAALSRLGGCVVSSGAKSLCDLPKTMETLETLGVPVVGFGTAELPAFTSIHSGVHLRHRVDTVEEAAAVVGAAAKLGLRQAVLIANPPPVGMALERETAETAIKAAIKGVSDVSGGEVTPRILDEIRRLTGGASVVANRALLNANGSLAAKIAVRLGLKHPT